VNAALLEVEDAKDRLLKKIIADHEPAYAAQWRSLDPSYAQKMLSGIVAFELSITRMECKLKLNQHRPESHAAMRSVYAAGNAHEQALGRWMDQIGIG
jgi:transcriptional regulator